jgi:glutaminase
MRAAALARLVVLAGLAAAGMADGAAQAATRIRLAQSSTVTNCMMACNAQAATCQTTCLVPGIPANGTATAGSNAVQSTSCQLNCTTQRLSCQTTCARNSPSP